MATGKKTQDDRGDGSGIQDLPDLVLLKIGSILDATDLLSFSQTSSKLFNLFSKEEPLWGRKLSEENLATDSPRLLKKAAGLENRFPVGCLSKRILLLRQKIRQNLKAGRLQKVSHSTLSEFFFAIGSFRLIGPYSGASSKAQASLV